MNEKDIINYWISSSEEDQKTAESLFEAKRYYHCLFFCHLFLEKILKAIYIKENTKLLLGSIIFNVLPKNQNFLSTKKYKRI